MKTPILLAIAAAFALGSGCIVVHDRARYHPLVVERCRPDEYWDGDHCRHKGHGWDHHH